MSQVDPQAAMQMAQQEMEYRVDLFNKRVGDTTTVSMDIHWQYVFEFVEW